MDDFDSPWKEAVEEWLREFVEFYYPAVAVQLDWTRKYEFLDKELQQLAAESEHRERTVDKLFRVHLLSGEESWILVHIEIQSQSDRTFAERMFVYRYRIFDKYRKKIASLAVLADEAIGWRPSEYRVETLGSELIYRYPIVKLLDFADREDWLETEANPFAMLTLAHLKTQETRHDPEARRNWKLRLAKGLYHRGYDAQQVRRLFRVIDWLLRLPKESERIFWEEMEQVERENKMPYITSVEQLARERGIEEGYAKGLEQGIQKGIEKGVEKGIERGIEKGIETGESRGLLAGIEAILEVRFGSAATPYLPELRAVRNPAKLGSILAALRSAQSIEDVRQLWLD